MSRLAGQHLVILGCGYVGAALARRARAEGVRVTGLTRNERTAAALEREGVAMVVADLSGDDWHRRIGGKVDHVVLCVSAAAPTPDGYRRSYVDGGASVRRWASGLPALPANLVYTSSTGVYPQGGGATVDESAELDRSGSTASILVQAEENLRAAPPVAGRVFVLRLAGIYGPGRHSLLEQLRSGAAVINGRGDHRLNLVHRDDVVGAILACLGAPAACAGGTFNVSDGQPATKAEVVGWLAERLGREAPEFDATSPSIRRGGAGIPDRLISNARIQRELGWRPAMADYRAGYAALLGEV